MQQSPRSSHERFRRPHILAVRAMSTGRTIIKTHTAVHVLVGQNHLSHGESGRCNARSRCGTWPQEAPSQWKRGRSLISRPLSPPPGRKLASLEARSLYQSVLRAWRISRVGADTRVNQSGAIPHLMVFSSQTHGRARHATVGAEKA